MTYEELAEIYNEVWSALTEGYGSKQFNREDFPNLEGANPCDNCGMLIPEYAELFICPKHKRGGGCFNRGAAEASNDRRAVVLRAILERVKKE